MSDFNNKLVIDLFEERDALKADVERLTTKVAQLYEGAEEQKQRIKRMKEAGDAMMSEPCEYTFEQWIKAKEAKP